MWKCDECKEKFEIPDHKKIDAGFDQRIIGYPMSTHTILLCPECNSTKIRKNIRKAG